MQLKPDVKTIFFIGNKRSGTSILAKSINLHPQIHITHESDLLWITYRLYKYGSIEFYKFDNDVTTKSTIQTCKNIIEKYQSMSPKEFFLRCHQKLMITGSFWNIPTDKVVSIIGDKKPSQTIEIIDWVQDNFPQSNYIHIIRHPLDFVKSCKRLDPPFDIMSGTSDQEKIELWYANESLVLKFKERHHVFSTTFQDFSECPEKFLTSTWKELGLNTCPINLPWKKEF